MNELSRTLSERLIAARWLLLAVAGVLALLAWRPAGQIEFDRSIENMFHADDPLLTSYRHLKELFGENEIVMAVYEDPELLASGGEGIRQLEQVDAQLRAIPGVREVLSLSGVNKALNFAHPLQRLVRDEEDQNAIVRPDSRLAVAYREMFEGYTHNSEGTVASLVCMLEPESEAGVSRRETIDRMRETIRQYPNGMIAGEPVMVMDGFRYLERDGRWLGWATRVLLALAIILCFGSVRWVVIPILVVQLSLLLTRATLVWFDLRLSMVSSMLTAIVTVVGVATVVHIIVRFRHARAQGLEQHEALVQTGTQLASPIFWACATDAVGFLSLMVAKVGPVRDFGLMTAIGSLWVLLSVILLVPGLALLGRFDSDPRRVWGDGLLGLELGRLARSAQHQPVRLLIALVLLFAGAIAGLLQLEVETDFTKNFRRGSQIVISYAYIEQNLGGAGVWDILLPAPNRLDREYVAQVRKLEQKLRTITIRDDAGRDVIGLTKVLSLVDGIDAATTNPLLARIPPELKARGMEVTMPHFMAALRTRLDEGQNYLRIMLRAREQQSAAEKSQLIDQVRQVTRDYFPGDAGEPAAEVTGFYVLLTNLITSVLRDQWTCFFVATVGVGLMMTIAFRSLLLAAIALVPNILPILIVMGAMGWMGIKVNLGAAMIAAVSMGLSVDSSIHYIISFRRARLAGQSVTAALADVQQSVGRAMVYSTIALVVGFLVLCSSQFVPTIYFGSLVSLAMLGGLLGNVVILPLLLNMAYGRGATDQDRQASTPLESPLP